MKMIQFWRNEAQKIIGKAFSIVDDGNESAVDAPLFAVEQQLSEGAHDLTYTIVCQQTEFNENSIEQGLILERIEHPNANNSLPNAIVVLPKNVANMYKGIKNRIQSWCTKPAEVGQTIRAVGYTYLVDEMFDFWEAHCNFSSCWSQVGLLVQGKNKTVQKQLDGMASSESIVVAASNLVPCFRIAEHAVGLKQLVSKEYAKFIEYINNILGGTLSAVPKMAPFQLNWSQRKLVNFDTVQGYPTGRWAYLDPNFRNYQELIAQPDAVATMDLVSLFLGGGNTPHFHTHGVPVAGDSQYYCVAQTNEGNIIPTSSIFNKPTGNLSAKEFLQNSLNGLNLNVIKSKSGAKPQCPSGADFAAALLEGVSHNVFAPCVMFNSDAIWIYHSTPNKFAVRIPHNQWQAILQNKVKIPSF